MKRRRFLALSAAAMVMQARAQGRPLRIVSTAPSITEALFALGVGAQVVGVSRFCDFPAEVQKLPKVGTYVKPDAEAIARLAPDLVLLQRASSELSARLHGLKMTFVEIPHGRLEDVYRGIGLMADACAVHERGVALVTQIRARLESIRVEAAKTPPAKVLVVIDRPVGTLASLTAVGPENYVNDLMTIAGGDNVLARAGVPAYLHISLETVLRDDPAYIVDLSGEANTEEQRRTLLAANLALWRAQPALTAVRQDQVLLGTSNALLVPGPRTPLAAQMLFNAMHGRGLRV